MDHLGQGGLFREMEGRGAAGTWRCETLSVCPMGKSPFSRHSDKLLVTVHTPPSLPLSSSAWLSFPFCSVWRQANLQPNIDRCSIDRLCSSSCPWLRKGRPGSRSQINSISQLSRHALTFACLLHHLIPHPFPHPTPTLRLEPCETSSLPFASLL